jgi:hypothetical protein
LIIIGKGEHIALGKTGEVPERVFENGFGVADVKERSRLGLKLDELARRKICRLNLKKVTGLQEQGLHEL